MSKDKSNSELADILHTIIEENDFPIEIEDALYKCVMVLTIYDFDPKVGSFAIGSQVLAKGEYGIIDGIDFETYSCDGEYKISYSVNGVSWFDTKDIVFVSHPTENSLKKIAAGISEDYDEDENGW